MTWTDVLNTLLTQRDTYLTSGQLMQKSINMGDGQVIAYHDFNELLDWINRVQGYVDAEKGSGCIGWVLLGG